MQAPTYDPELNLNGQFAINDFQVAYNASGSFGQTNAVRNKMVEK